MAAIKNILYIIDRFAHGGTERQLAALVGGIDKDLYQPHVCTLKPSQGLYDNLECPKRQLAFRSLLRPSSLNEIRTLVGLVRKWNIDLIHTFFQDPFAVGAMVKRFHPSVLIGSFRDMGFWRTPAENLKMRLAYPSFDGFIANSNAVKRHFVTTDGLVPERVEVIYNGYNGLPTNISDNDRSQSSAPPTVGIVANFNRPVKRLEDYLEAAEIIKANMPDARFVIVGAIGDLYRNRVHAVQRKLGGSLELTGNVATPMDHIRRFDIGVITSETEGFCNAIIEYMMNGLPVVATDTGGNPEMIRNEENGFLVPVGDHRALAGAVMRLLQNERLRSQMGRRNRFEARDRFGIERMVKDYQRSYHQMIDAAARVRRRMNCSP